MKIWPFFHPGSPYEILRKHMTNCIEEIFYKVNEWMDTKFATYGNFENTFSGHVYDPIIYDYIFYRTNTDKARAYTNWFELPLFKTKLLIESLIDTINDNINQTIADASETTTTTTPTPTESPVDSSKNERSKRDITTKEKLISFSDHEAVTSTIYLRF